MTIGVFSFALIASSANAELSCPDCGSDEQESLEDSQILLWTDKSTYDHDDSIIVEGIVTKVVSGVPVTLTVMSSLNSVITIDSLLVDNDGSFGIILNTADNLWKYDGTYTIKVNYGSAEKNTSVQVELIDGVEPGSPYTTPEPNLRIIGKTDQSSYESGDRVVVSGYITNFDYSAHSDIALTYRISDTTGNIVTIGKTFPNTKGVFSFDFVAGGSLFKLSGDYPIQLIFGSVNDEISMTYTGGEFQSALPSGPSSTLPPTFNPRGLSDAIITITIKGDSIFYLDSPNAIIRGNVEIFDFSPSDGYYFMKVIHLPTQKVLKDFEIYPKYSGNDLWSVQIAYPILDTDIQFGGQTLYGEYRIEVTSEYGGQTGSTSFFIFESPDYSIIKVPEWVKNNAKWWADGLIDDKTFVSGIQFLIKERILNVDTIQSSTQSSTNSQVPPWIKTNADWWARGLITDGDFLKGIEYLVKNNIIDVSEKSPYQSQDDLPYKIPTGIVEPIIVTTDKTSYSEGETILVTGEVSEILFGYAVSLLVIAPNGNVVVQDQVIVDSDKKYSTELTAGGSLMKASGEYTIQVLYATENRAAETTFTFGGSTTTVSDNLIAVVGTDFMVGYEITGGNLISITPDRDFNSLIIAIDTTDNGQLTITLSRALIDSKYGDTDDDFIVLVDNEGVYFEETSTSVDRTLVISFPAGAEEIEIIGSFLS